MTNQNTKADKTTDVNTTPAVLTSKVRPAQALEFTLRSAKTAHTAALQLCYSAACYILTVNVFTNAKDKAFMPRGKAIDHINEQIAEHTGVKGNMLAVYVRNASALAGVFSDNQTMFGPELAKLAAAETPEAMVTLLDKQFNAMHENKGLRRKIDSLRTLSEALGFAVSHNKPGGNAMTPAKVPERVANVMEAANKLVADGKVTERTVAQAAVLQATKPIVYVQEAIKRLTDESECDIAEQDIKKQRKVIRERNEKLSREAAIAAKSKAKEGASIKLTPAKKGKGQTQRRAA